MLHPDWVHYLRSIEIELLVELLRAHRPDATILEIGGGDGYMARQLADAGFDLTCTDPSPRKPAYFEVTPMRGGAIDFPDNSFDVIFSSNVLEHIVDVDAALQEMRRVLRPGGVMFHSVPTPSCVVLTMLAQPPSYLRNAALIATGKLELPDKPNEARHKRAIRYGRKARKQLSPIRFFLGPGHGESRTHMNALRIWRRQAWLDRFELNSIRVRDVVDVDTAFSMHKLFPFRFMALRQRLSRMGLASVTLYVLEF